MSMTHPADPWRAEVRRQAHVAVKVAAARRTAADTTLAYFLRTALGHGLTVAEVCKASGLDEATVLQLTDPAAGAA